MEIVLMYYKSNYNSIYNLIILDHTLQLKYKKTFNYMESKVVFLNTPILADLNRDGQCEIILKSIGGPSTLLILNGTGNEILRKRLSYPTASSDSFSASYCCVGNFNSNKELEIVIADCFYNQNNKRFFSYMTVLNPNGNKLKNLNKMLINSSIKRPAAADLDGNGFDEIIVIDYSRRIHIYNSFGEKILEKASQYYLDGFPAFGDVNIDGKLEIAMIGSQYSWPSTNYVLLVFDINGNTLFEKPIDSYSNYSPIIVDFDGDRNLDILVGSSHGIFGYNRLGNELEGFPIIDENIAATRGIAITTDDIDNNGKLELLYAVENDRSNLTHSTIYVWDTTTKYSMQFAPWTTHMHDTGHTGRFEIFHVCPPQNLKIERIVEGGVFRKIASHHIYWEKNDLNAYSRIFEYYIYRRESASEDLHFMKIAQVNKDTLFFIDSNVNAETKFEYTITAIDESGIESYWSSLITSHK
jgi:hypothetical protein